MKSQTSGRFVVALYRLFVSWVLVIGMAGLVGGCGADSGDSCTVKDKGDGTKTLFCPDGTEAVLNTGSSTTGTGPEQDAGTDEDAGTDGKILEGSYTIGNSLDVEFLLGFTQVTGNLAVVADGLTSFSLPALTYVGGYLSVMGNDALTSFELPALTSVVGDDLEMSKITT
jgi:hypothetical protein